MTRLDRPEAPPILSDNAEAWGIEFAERREKDPSYRFNWRSFGGQSVRDIILPILKEATKNHCSFCDGSPLGAQSRATIEHFRPKSRFPKEVYVWGNLFLCCDVCQSAKLERFDDDLLKPDDGDYEFGRYFVNDYKTGELKPNPYANEEDKNRAAITIQMYDLNAIERKKARLGEYRRYNDLIAKGYELDDFPYRFFIA